MKKINNMKRHVIFLMLFFAVCAHAQSYDCLHLYYKGYRRALPSSVQIFSDGRVELNDVLNHGQTITGQKNAVGDTVTFVPGQLVYINAGANYYLYVYENSSANMTKNIQFVCRNFSDGMKLECTTPLCYAAQDGSSPIHFSNVSYDTRKNATVETEVWQRSNNTFMHNDTYRVHVHQNIKGDIWVDYFGRKNQACIRQKSNGSISMLYNDNAILFSSSLKNTYNVVETRLNSEGSAYNSYSNTLSGTLADDTIHLNPWMMLCDNRNNTSVPEADRKIYVKDSVCKNMSIVMDGSYNLRLPSPHVVSDGELILTTQANFLTAASLYWMWTGNEQNETDAIQITNKKSTIQPGTDRVISQQTVTGLNIKNHGNTSKNIYAYVTGCSSVKYYVTSNGSDERTTLVRAIPENGGAAIESTLATPSTGAVGLLEGLDAQEVYEIEFYTSEKDVTLYALQFNAPIYTGVADEKMEVCPTKIVRDGAVVILKNGAAYNLLGAQIR